MAAPYDKISDIDNDEITLGKEIGYGSFGTVHKAEWRYKLVAVKEFSNQRHKDIIEKEIRNLYRLLPHPNIIDVYGISGYNSEIFLIMEYANCGSLEKFLHSPPKYTYSQAHALNWMLQCAKAVKYLHSIKPKPIFHRDLKPSNLMLTNRYRTLKICDFGKIAEIKTIMTRGKESVIWMAPEVLMGKLYTEKIDVFSFGIILWEVFARQRPYEEKLESIWSIGFHKVNGGRPKLNENWPKEVQKLIEMCWDQEPSVRPDMESIVKSLEDISRWFIGGDEPLGFSLKRYPVIDCEDIKEMETIGHGSLGKVYKAKWYNLPIALKEFWKTKEIEFQVPDLCRVAFHPNIINIYGVSELNYKFYLIMEYADCGSLQKFLYIPPKYDYSTAHAVNWMTQCAEAICYLHNDTRRPFIHGDIKPANLLLVNQYRTLKICDFGTVAEFKKTTTQGKGSIPWMAPEIIGKSNYTSASDIFSFGITLWEVLARHQPYEGKFDSPWAILNYVKNGGRPELNEIWPHKVKSLIEICWDQEPSNRRDMIYVVKTLRALNKSLSVIGGLAPLGCFVKDKIQAAVEDDYSRASSSNESNLRRLYIDSQIKVTKVFRMEQRSISGSYSITKKRAGYALIINQKSFSEVISTRKGPRTDQQLLISTFSSFGYVPIETNCSTLTEMVNVTQEIVRKSVEYDSLIVCLLQNYAEDNTLFEGLKTIQQCMDSDCLRGKPKMLLVPGDSCHDYTVEMMIADDFFGTTALTRKDMLTVYEIVQHRRLCRGSCFIETLCEYINRRGHRVDMVEILNDMQRRLSLLYEEFDKMPLGTLKITNTLQKLFYLPNRD